MNMQAMFSCLLSKVSNSQSINQVNAQLIHFEQQLKTLLLNIDTDPKEQLMLLLANKLEPAINTSGEHKLDRATTFLICVYYIKLQVSANDNCNHINLDSSTLQEWLLNITGEKVVIPKEYVNRVKFKDKIITLESGIFKTTTIDIRKYIAASYFQAEPQYTTKPQQYKLGEIYNNADGVCDGAASNFLESFANALRQPKPLRHKEKINFLKELKAKNSQLISRKSYNKLYYYHYLKPNLSNLRLMCKMNISNHNFTQAFVKISELMANTNVNPMFIKFRTYQHVMALVVIQYGEWYKFIYYEPNDSQTWCKMYFHKSEISLTSYRLNSFWTNLAYFKVRKDEDIQVLLEAYVYPTTTEQVANLILEIPADKFEQQQLLLMAIDTEHIKLMREILKQTSLNLNFYFRGLTPLIMVIRQQNYDAVKLFLEHGADPSLEALPRVILLNDLAEFERKRDLIFAINNTQVMYKTQTGLESLDLNEFYEIIGFFPDSPFNSENIHDLQRHMDLLELSEFFPTLLTGVSPLEAVDKIFYDQTKIRNLIQAAL